MTRPPDSKSPTAESSEEMPPPAAASAKSKTGEKAKDEAKAKTERDPASAAPTGRKQSPPSLLDQPLTDLGNAERLVALHGADLRYSKSLGWLAWDGKRWPRDQTGEVMRRAKRTVRELRLQALRIRDEDRRKAVIVFALGSEAVGRLTAMVTLAESEPTIAITANMLDVDPWLLNVQNRTINLHTGELREHRREDLLTKLAPVAYDKAAHCPRWDQFMEEVQPDAETRGYVKRLSGYAATAVVRDHILPILYGKGRNGKGVFTNTLQFVLGDYATTVPTEVLMAKQNDQHPTERMTLFGCRLAVASETEQNRQLATAMVKQLTGGDPITGRYMRRDFVTFLPSHKLMLATNNRPVIKETKDAIWDRVHLIPWIARFVGAKQDKTLGEKLKAEASGILRWLVDGCLEWQRVGLDPPASVVAATAQYRSDMDAIGDFIAEKCFLAADARVTRSALRNAYEAWCVEVGERFPAGAKAFAEQLRERELVEVPSMRMPGKKTPERGWQGIRLRTPADDPVDTYARVDADPGETVSTHARGAGNPGKVSTGAYVSTSPSEAGGGSAATPVDREVLEL